MASDPFDCFGNEDEDHADDSNTTTDTNRDEACGVLSFHKHTEHALLTYIQTSMDSSPTVERILSAVDQFCNQRHWMMHVGPDKGRILTQILQEEIESFLQGADIQQEFNCVELGTYCGYSSILIASVLQRYSLTYPHIRFHLYTFEIHPEFVHIANAMIALAQLQNFVTLTPINLYMDGSVDDISVLAEREIKRNQPSSSTTSLHIHFLFIDHDKDLYLLDLRKLERSSLIKQGSCVVADNVLFAHIDDYLYYVKALQDKHIVRTRTIESIVEYSHGSIQDGLECTKYIQDPLGFADNCI